MHCCLIRSYASYPSLSSSSSPPYSYFSRDVCRPFTFLLALGVVSLGILAFVDVDQSRIECRAFLLSEATRSGYIIDDEEYARVRGEGRGGKDGGLLKQNLHEGDDSKGTAASKVVEVVLVDGQSMDGQVKVPMVVGELEREAVTRKS